MDPDSRREQEIISVIFVQAINFVYDTKAQTIEGEHDNLDLILNKIFFFVKDTIKGMKRQSTIWEIFTNHVSYTSLYPEYTMHSQNSTIKE